MLNLWVRLGWVGLVCLVGLLLFSAVIFCFVLEGQVRFADSLCEALRWAARLLTSTSSNTMSFVVAELMSLCDPAETVKLGEWPQFFSHRNQ